MNRSYRRMDYFPVTYFYLTSLCPDLDTEKHLGFIFCTQQHLAVATYRKLRGTRFRFDSWLSSISRGRQLLCLAEVVSQQGGQQMVRSGDAKRTAGCFHLPSQMFVWCCFSLAFKDTGNQFFTVGWAAFMPKTNSCNEILQLLYSRCPGGGASCH